MTQQQPEEETPRPFEEYVVTELATLRGCVTGLAVFAGAADPLAAHPAARTVRGLSSAAVEAERGSRSPRGCWTRH